MQRFGMQDSMVLENKACIYIYEVCPKSLWTSLSKVLDKHICLKAYAIHKVQHQLNKCSKFHEIAILELMWGSHYGAY